VPVVQESPSEFLDYGFISSGGLNHNSKPIKVLSYNIWNLNYYEGTTYEQKMLAITKEVQALDVDIIGFQEVRFSNIHYPRRYISRIICNAP
jgi:endonuclease/exonuclease/phosphatase family metal-dependent hydrolase